MAEAAAETVFRRRVDSADTDASGVMHFARYPVLMETAILDELEVAGLPLQAARERSLDLRVSNVEVDYRRPARLRDELAVGAELVDVGPASLRFQATVRRDGEDPVLARGRFHFAVVSSDGGEPRAIPGDLRDRLEART